QGEAQRQVVGRDVRPGREDQLRLPEGARRIAHEPSSVLDESSLETPPPASAAARVPVTRAAAFRPLAEPARTEMARLLYDLAMRRARAIGARLPAILARVFLGALLPLAVIQQAGH